MNYQVGYTGLAKLEVEAAFAWYMEQAGTKVAERFMEEIDRVEGHLRSNPHLYQRIADGVRHLVLRRYPYALIFAIDEQVVTVLGCLHSRREPFTLKDWLARGAAKPLTGRDDIH